MEMSADDAIRQFNKWRQDRSQLRLMLSVSSVSLALAASGEVLEVSLADGRVAVKIGDFEFSFLTLDAAFEYAEPREAQLSSIGISQANCLCCLTVNFRDSLEHRVLPVAALMICELRGD